MHVSLYLNQKHTQPCSSEFNCDFQWTVPLLRLTDLAELQSSAHQMDSQLTLKLMKSLVWQCRTPNTLHLPTVHSYVVHWLFLSLLQNQISFFLYDTDQMSLLLSSDSHHWPDPGNKSLHPKYLLLYSIIAEWDKICFASGWYCRN